MLMKTSASFRDEDAVQLLVGCALGIAAHALVAWLAAVVGLFLMTDAPGKLSNHLGSIAAAERQLLEGRGGLREDDGVEARVGPVGQGDGHGLEPQAPQRLERRAVHVGGGRLVHPRLHVAHV